MGFRAVVKGILKKILAFNGFVMIPKVNVYDWQTGDLPQKSRKIYLPENAEDYLTPENPILRKINESYRESDYPSGEVLVWTDDLVNASDLLYFRGHNAYVFQEGSCNRNLIGYLLAYYYTKSIDQFGLLNSLKEDTAFGAHTYRIDEREISRDLIDSILEIYFLERNLGIFQIDDFTVLDIGAGYGRLAHRMANALPNLKSYYCTDAIAVSAFIADYYLQFRQITEKARVIPLNTIRDEVDPDLIDLAVNIHSFSECTLPAIEWWLALLQDKKVPYLLIVPNSGDQLLTNDKKDFSPLLQTYGFELVTKEPKYLDPIVQKYAMNPDHYHLYKRK